MILKLLDEGVEYSATKHFILCKLDTIPVL